MSGKSPKRPHRKYAFKRAARACQQCQKSKTRCNYLNNGKSCFRCANLGLECSLSESRLSQSDFAKMVADPAAQGLETEIKKVQLDLQEILRRLPPRRTSSLASLLNEDPPSTPAKNGSITAGSASISAAGSASASASSASNANTSSVGPAQPDKLYFSMTPFSDVRAAGVFLGMPFTKEMVYNYHPAKGGLGFNAPRDIIDLGYVSEEVAIKLVSSFLEHYSQWIHLTHGVGSGSGTPVDQVKYMRKESPLLLAVVCLMGFEHYEAEDPSLYANIIKHISGELSASVVQIPQSSKFLQSLVLISNFALSLSCGDVYFDAWYLSAYAAMHFVARDRDLNIPTGVFNDDESVSRLRLWNRLVLAHLTNCVLSGRPCLIDEIRLDLCREVLSTPAATDLDRAIVTEISVVLALYNCLQFEEPLEASLRELSSTWVEWQSICTSTVQEPFAEIYYRFAKVMVYRREFLKMFDIAKHQALGANIVPSDKENEYMDELKSVVPLLDNCISLIGLASKADKKTLIAAPDTVKYIVFFCTLQVINMARLGFTAERFGAERLKTVRKAIADSLSVYNCCTESIRFLNDFAPSCAQMISKLAESIPNM